MYIYTQNIYNEYIYIYTYIYVVEGLRLFLTLGVADIVCLHVPRGHPDPLTIMIFAVPEHFFVFVLWGRTVVENGICRNLR